MKPVVKYILLATVAMTVLLLAVVVIFAATFDPNQYKPQIVQAVKDRTGRTLTLDGDIGIALFPSLGAKIGKASLSEKGSDREFAGVDSLRVSVRLLPLLSKQVVVDAVELKGLRANIVKQKGGGTNFDDLTGQTAPPPAKGAEPKAAPASPVAIDIAKVEIEDASVRYLDQASGAQYVVSKLGLKTGRLAEGVPTNIELAAHVGANKPKVDADIRAKTKLTFRLGEQRYVLDGLDAAIKGAVADISNLNATAKGDVDVRLATGEIGLAKLSVAATGKQAGGDLDVKLDAPKLALTREKVAGEKVTVDVKANTAVRKLSAKAVIPGVEGSFQAFRTGPLEATMETQADGRTMKAKLNGVLSGNLEARRFDLPKFTAEVNATDPKLPKPAALTLTGAARADLQKESAGIEFTGKLDDSALNGKAGVARFSPLALTFDLAIDKLDADRYLANSEGKPAAGGSGGKGDAKGGAATKGESGKIDLTVLKGLNVNGSVKVGDLKAHNLKLTQARADVKVANGRLDVSPLAANLYQGTLAGSLSAQASATPVFAIKQTLSGVNVGPLLKDGANIDTVEGRGTLTLDLTAQGASADALKKALNGSAGVTLVDGALKGIDLGALVRNAKNAVRQLRGRELLPPAKSEKTEFSEAKGTFIVKNGVAANNDLSIKSPLVRVGGDGTIDIGNDRLDYLVRATVATASAGQGGKDAADLQGITVPVRLTGPLGAPQYTVDYAAVAAELAKVQLEGRQDELKTRLQERLNRFLRK